MVDPSSDKPLRTLDQEPASGWTIKGSGKVGWLEFSYGDATEEHSTRSTMAQEEESQGPAKRTSWSLRIDAVNMTISGIFPIQKPSSATKIYDLSGRPINSPTRGLIIKGGKKVIQYALGSSTQQPPLSAEH